MISFNQNIFYKYKDANKLTNNLTKQLVNKNIPKIILYKYWLRLYTLPGGFFYTDLNRDLRKSSINICTYFPFIKACYEGIRKGFFKPEIDSILYRGQGITKEEFKDIYSLYKDKKNNNDMPKMIITAKCFLSFSKRKEVALGFLSDVGEDFIKVLFIIENIDDKQIDKNLVTNADIIEFSRFKDEEEVLFFPLSCFEVKEIKKENNIQKIKLEYLVKYKNLINNELKNIEVINNTEFSNYLINIGAIENDYIRPIWIKKDEIDLKVTDIYFLLDKTTDLVGYKGNLIYIFSIKGKIKQTINEHSKEILCIIKLKEDQICSSSKDKTIKILKLTKNNTKYNQIKTINLEKYYAKMMLYSNNIDILILKNNNSIDSYNLNNKELKENFFFEFCDDITNIMELPNKYLIYIKENNNNKILRIREIKKYDEIELKPDLIKNQNMIYYNNYILIASDYRINILNITETKKQIRIYFEMTKKITNIVSISSNRFILGLYDSEKKESIIREYLINEKEHKINLEIIGIGKLKDIIIAKIIKINELKLLVKAENGALIIIEKLCKFRELLKEKNLLKEDEEEINAEELNINNDVDDENEIIENIQNNDEIKINAEEEKEKDTNIISTTIEKENDNFNKEKLLQEENITSFNYKAENKNKYLNENKIEIQSNIISIKIENKIKFQDKEVVNEKNNQIKNINETNEKSNIIKEKKEVDEKSKENQEDNNKNEENKINFDSIFLNKAKFLLKKKEILNKKMKSENKEENNEIKIDTDNKVKIKEENKINEINEKIISKSNIEENENNNYIKIEKENKITVDENQTNEINKEFYNIINIEEKNKSNLINAEIDELNIKPKEIDKLEFNPEIKEKNNETDENQILNKKLKVETFIKSIDDKIEVVKDKKNTLQKQIKEIDKEITELQLSEKPLQQKKIEHKQKIEKIKIINNQINNLEHEVLDLEASKIKIENSIFNNQSNQSTEIDYVKDKKSNNNLKTSTMSFV